MGDKVPRSNSTASRVSSAISDANKAILESGLTPDQKRDMHHVTLKLTAELMAVADDLTSTAILKGGDD